MKSSVRFYFVIFLLLLSACQPVSTSPAADSKDENSSDSDSDVLPEEEAAEESAGGNYDLEVKDEIADVETCSGNTPTEDPVADLTSFNISNIDGFISLNVILAQGIDSDPPMDIFIEFDNDAVPTAESGGGQRTILVNFFSVVFNGGWFDALTGETDNTAMTISWHRPTGVLNIEFPNEYLGAGEIAVSVSSIHRLPESTCDSTASGLFTLE